MSAISTLRGVAVASALSNERRLETRLWLIQRVSALVLAGCVIVHLITIVYAVRSGLSAATILGRLRGSLAWMAFYGIFVVAVALHGPIGLRAIRAKCPHFNAWIEKLEKLGSVKSLPDDAPPGN